MGRKWGAVGQWHIVSFPENFSVATPCSQSIPSLEGGDRAREHMPYMACSPLNLSDSQVNRYMQQALLFLQYSLPLCDQMKEKVRQSPYRSCIAKGQSATEHQHLQIPKLCGSGKL